MSSSTRPGKIGCVGRNYVDHAKELGNDVPKEPLIFLKPPTSVIRNGESIVLPPESKQVEFRSEFFNAVNHPTFAAPGTNRR